MRGVNTIPMTMISVALDSPSATTPRMPVTTSGQGEERLDETADDVVHGAAEVAHDQAERGAERWCRAAVASGAVMRIGREPTITRASTSRPSWSVPNRCALDGALLMLSRFWASGSWTISEPKIAARIQKPRMNAPTMNAG